MTTNFRIEISSLGLEKNYLYEILATTFSIENNLLIPNTASMGVRLVNKKSLKIWPFSDTTTYRNIEKCKLVVLNFVDDVYLYALASLKSSNLSKDSHFLSKDYYNHYPHNLSREHNDIGMGNPAQIPYIRQSWAIILCKAINFNQILKQDDFGESKLMEINLTALLCKKFKESSKLYNRAENLTLETIVLSTKLKVAVEKKNKALVEKIKGEIEDNLSKIQRFGKNISALKAVEHIERYIKRFEI